MKRKVILVLMVVFALFVVACTPSQDTESMQNNDMQDSMSGKGKAIFTITDAAAQMGSVSEIMVTIDSVRVHSESEGWVNVAQDVGSYNLLELKAAQAHELLAQVELNEGRYDQLRLDISKVVVVDDEGEHEAKLPSGELKIKGEFEVKENQTSSASFDFIADESLHVTGNAKYIMAPVVQLETRSNVRAQVSSNNRVEISGGNVQANVKVGMDENGNVGVGVKIPANAQVDLNSKGLVIATGAKSKGNVDANSDEQESNVEVDAALG